MSGIISATAVGSTFGVIFLGLFGLAAHLDMQPYTAGYRLFAICFGFLVGTSFYRSCSR